MARVVAEVAICTYGDGSRVPSPLPDPGMDVASSVIWAELPQGCTLSSTTSKLNGQSSVYCGQAVHRSPLDDTKVGCQIALRYRSHTTPEEPQMSGRQLFCGRAV